MCTTIAPRTLPEREEVMRTLEQAGFTLPPHEQGWLWKTMACHADPSLPQYGWIPFENKVAPDQRWFYFLFDCNYGKKSGTSVVAFCGEDMKSDWSTDLRHALYHCYFNDAVKMIYVDLLFHVSLPVLVMYPDGQFEVHKIG